MADYTSLKGKSRRYLDPSGREISRRQYIKAMHGGKTPEKLAKERPAKPAKKYNSETVKTASGNVYHLTPIGKTTVKDQWTTSPHPGKVMKTTPSMWRVRRMFAEVGRKKFYTIGFHGRLKRSGEVRYPPEDAPEIHKSVVIDDRTLQYAQFHFNSTLAFANWLCQPFDYEWYQIYAVSVWEHT